MAETRQSLSLFAHPADRGTFVAYFLGAIVPLVALGVVIERFVLAPIGVADSRTYLIGGANSDSDCLVSATDPPLGCFGVSGGGLKRRSVVGPFSPGWLAGNGSGRAGSSAAG